ncbi:hypothetical protein C9374_014159 [Naegleria lovaniensis]|uniref:Chloride channel protein n=1 Tax=Naegleria lovaniensis TaxID=51637 RepID=A0AA88H1Q8_NAELO|nr:uncharacterized protein C9374_014159 [Naegleria lovaniensis]KAG2389599.1 hypothetical protein C9374_014159 [Naegleria lovaniensis]
MTPSSGLMPTTPSGSTPPTKQNEPSVNSLIIHSNSSPSLAESTPFPNILNTTNNDYHSHSRLHDDVGTNNTGSVPENHVVNVQQIESIEDEALEVKLSLGKANKNNKNENNVSSSLLGEEDVSVAQEHALHSDNALTNTNTSSQAYSEVFMKDILSTVKLANDAKYKESLESFKKGFKAFQKQKFVWTYLTLIGFTGGVVAYTHELIVRYMFQGRLAMINAFDPVEYFGLRLFLWVIFNLAFVYGAALLTVFIAPTAEGSGIPPLKAILNGAGLKDPISFRTLVVKCIALPAVLGSGMFVGKVGPTIHIGACIANNFLNIPIFKPIKKVKTLKMQMIACGCALGVAANFSTPGGGVLFALEAVGTYYSLRNYLKTFYVAVVAAFTSRLFNAAVNLNLNFVQNWTVRLPFPSYTIPELIAHAILGVLMSFVGIGFTYLNEKVLQLRDRYGKRYLIFKSERLAKYKFMLLFENKIFWTIFVCIVTSILTFPQMIGKFMSLTPGATVEELLSPKPLTSENGLTGEWIKNSPTDVFSSLAVFCLLRFVVSSFSVNLPIPAGIYIPLVIIGAGCGRLYGEIVAVIFPNGFVPGQPIYAGAFAAVGIVACSAASTHAFSTVFIFLEIVGIAAYLPSLMAALIAVFISRASYRSIYDSIIKIRGWPALLESGTDSEDLKVSNLIQSFDSLDLIEETTSLHEIKTILSKKALPKVFPVVNNKKEMLLLGQVSLKSLEAQYQTRKLRMLERVHRVTLPSPQHQETTFVSATTGQVAEMKATNVSGELYDVELVDKQEEERFKNYTFTVEYENCEITLAENQSAQTAHMLFSQLGLNDVFVVWKGRLMGQLHRQMLMRVVVEREKSALSFLFQ